MLASLIRAKVLASLALAGIAAGVFLVPEAPAVQLALAKVKCNGWKCGGSAIEQYHYDVIPGSNAVSAVDVGLHHLFTAINIVMPTGWTVTVNNGMFGDDPFTVHGVVSTGPSGTCPYILHFSGPSQSSAFVLAYDIVEANQPHDVKWTTSDGAFAVWSKPVGRGQGPIHSPILDN